MAGLCDLPIELLVQIGEYLDRKSLCSIRLVHRSLQAATEHYFRKRLFRKKGYLITTPSLNVLLSIAAHPELAKYVEHIWFNPDLYTHVIPSCALVAHKSSAPVAGVDAPDPEDTRAVRLLQETPTQRAQFDAYEQCMTDHAELLHTDALYKVLQTAIYSLPNLRVIGMRRGVDHSPWGWSRLQKSIGDDPRVIGPRPKLRRYRKPRCPPMSEPTSLFVAIIRAMGSSGNTETGQVSTDTMRVERLYTDTIELEKVNPLTHAARLASAFRHLRHLDVNIDSFTSMQHEELRGHDDPEALEIAQLLRTAAPQLNELGLKSVCLPDEPQGITTLNLPLVHLTRVKLEIRFITSDQLIALLAGSAGVLRSVKLRAITLKARIEAWIEAWRDVFRFLATRCGKLECLLLHDLRSLIGKLRFRPPRPLAVSLIDEEEDEVDRPVEECTLRAIGAVDVRDQLANLVACEGYDLEYATTPCAELDAGEWYTDTSDDDDEEEEEEEE